MSAARQSDALAIALLNGQDKSIDAYHRSAVARRACRQDMAELDRHREKEERLKEQVWAEHQAVLDRIEFERLTRRQPRVRQL